MNALISLTAGLRRMLDNVLYQFSSKNKSKLKSLKGKYQGKPLVIVGNGPSLNKVPMDKIKYPCIGMNKIDLMYDRTTWRPEMVACINGLVIRQNKTVYNETEIPTVLPVKAKYLGIKSRGPIFFVRETKQTQFENDLIEGVGAGFTVTYTALQLAYYMGANPVYLIGVDHSFNYVGKSNEVQKMDKQDENHFDPRYFQGQLWGLPDLEASEVAYHQAKVAFEADGRNVYDATIDGKLNIFDKKDIKEIMID